MDLSYGIPALYLNGNNNGRRSTLSALVLPRMLSNDSYAALSERVKYRERGLICPSVRAVDQCLTPKEPNAAYPIGLAAGYSFSFPVSVFQRKGPLFPLGGDGLLGLRRLHDFVEFIRRPWAWAFPAKPCMPGSRPTKPIRSNPRTSANALEPALVRRRGRVSRSGGGERDIRTVT